MTQWRTPGEPSRPPAAPDAQPHARTAGEYGAQPQAESAAGAAPDRTGRTQWFVLGVAGAFIVAAIVLLVVVLAGGNDSPPAARPSAADRVTDRLAAAVQAGSVRQVRNLACLGAQQQVVNAARPAFGAAAGRQGIAKIQATVAVGQLSVEGSARTATVALRRSGPQWCVASVVVGG